MRQECSLCHKDLDVIGAEKRIERHTNLAGKICDGSYYQATWHSRELEFLSMVDALEG